MPLHTTYKQLVASVNIVSCNRKYPSGV